MYYNKEAVCIAGQQYVQETTKWPGHTSVINRLVEYG